MSPNDPEQLPDLVRQLLSGPVDSFEKLEVLLALDSAAGVSLRLGEVAARARLAAEQVEMATADLMAAALIERTGTDTWRICREAVASVAELARAWVTRRPEVLKLMTDRALARVRAAAARRFADAFRFRRDGGDGDDDG